MPHITAKSCAISPNLFFSSLHSVRGSDEWDIKALKSTEPGLQYAPDDMSYYVI